MNFMKVLYGRSGVAYGVVIRAISSRFYVDDACRHVEVCSGRCRKGFNWTMRGSLWRSAPGDFVKVLSGLCGMAYGGWSNAIS